MKNTVKTIIMVVTLLMSLHGYGQNQNQSSLNFLTLVDTVSSAKVLEIQLQLKDFDVEIATQSKKLNKVYRDVPIDKEIELNLREDSIYMSMLSKRCELAIILAETKKNGIQNVLNRLNARPQPYNMPPHNTSMSVPSAKPTKSNK